MFQQYTHIVSLCKWRGTGENIYGRVVTYNISDDHIFYKYYIPLNLEKSNLQKHCYL